MAMLAAKLLCELLPRSNRISNPTISKVFFFGRGGKKKDPCTPKPVRPTKSKDCPPKPACPPKPCPPPEPCCPTDCPCRSPCPSPASKDPCTPKPPCCPPAPPKCPPPTPPCGSPCPPKPDCPPSKPPCGPPCPPKPPCPPPKPPCGPPCPPKPPCPPPKPPCGPPCPPKPACPPPKPPCGSPCPPKADCPPSKPPCGPPCPPKPPCPPPKPPCGPPCPPKPPCPPSKPPCGSPCPPKPACPPPKPPCGPPDPPKCPPPKPPCEPPAPPKCPPAKPPCGTPCPSKPPCPPPKPPCGPSDPPKCPPSKPPCGPPSPPKCPPPKPPCGTPCPSKPPCPPPKPPCGPPDPPKCPPSKPPCPPAPPKCPSPPSNPSPAINGKVAVITGGSLGIGYYCALAILKNGGKVMLGDVKVDEGKKAICKIVEEFGYDKAAFIKCDVTKVEDMECLFDAALCEFQKIDIVINNAGILQDKYWAKTADINVKGVICGTLLGFQHMRKNRNGGTIINVSSVLGHQPCHPCPVYCGTKHFIIGFSRSMGHDFYYCQTGVKVMTLCPGVTITAMVEDAGKNPQLEGFGDTSKELQKELHSFPKQSAEVCGMHVVPVLEANINGSDWISEDSETYRVKQVDRKTLRIC